MQFIQVGEIGKAVIVAYETDLPTPSVKFVDKYFVVSATKYVYTCKLNDSGAYAWARVKVLPSLSNGILSGSQLAKDVEALDANGDVVTGTLELVEKTIDANGVYTAADEGKAGYSKVTVELAGSTAENPYIATTVDELKAYIAPEYRDAFVRYDRADKRITTPATVTFSQVVSGSSYFDSYLGERTMCNYVDGWLNDVDSKTILKYSGTKTITILGVSINVVHDISIIAARTLNTDGSYCRVLYAIDKHNSEGDTYVSTDEILLWVSNYIDKLPDDVTITEQMLTHIEYNGWYQRGNGYDQDSEGYSTLSYIITGFKSPYIIDVAVGNALAITEATSTDLQGKGYYGTPTRSEYLDGSVYKIKYGGKVGDKQAVSPLQVGDNLAGQTVYIDLSLTKEQVVAILETVDWENAMDDGEGGKMYRVFNGASPADLSEEDTTKLYKAYYAMVLQKGKGGDYGIISLAYDAENAYIFMSSDAGFMSTKSSFVIPASFPDPNDDTQTIAQDAKITNIWCSSVLNKLFGKTNEFAITSYNDYYFLEQQGDVIDVAREGILDSKINKYNMNKVYNYTGYTGAAYKYKNGLYLITED